MEESAFLKEQATAATAHKDSPERTVRSVRDAYTLAHSQKANKHTDTDMMKSPGGQAISTEVRLSNGKSTVSWPFFSFLVCVGGLNGGEGQRSP